VQARLSRETTDVSTSPSVLSSVKLQDTFRCSSSAAVLLPSKCDAYIMGQKDFSTSKSLIELLLRLRSPFDGH